MNRIFKTLVIILCVSMITGTIYIGGKRLIEKRNEESRMSYRTVVYFEHADTSVYILDCNDAYPLEWDSVSVYGDKSKEKANIRRTLERVVGEARIGEGVILPYMTVDSSILGNPNYLRLTLYPDTSSIVIYGVVKSVYHTLLQTYLRKDVIITLKYHD